MTIPLFLWNAYVVGWSMTTLALGLASIRRAGELLRGEGSPPDVEDTFLRGVVTDFGRAFAWPIYIWRPW